MLSNKLLTGLLTFCIVLICLLSVKQCNNDAKGDIDNLLLQNKSYEKQIKEISKSKESAEKEAEQWHRKYEQDSAELSRIKKEKSVLSAKIASIKEQIKSIQPKVKADAEAIVLEFAMRTTDICHEDSTDECLNDSAVIPIGRIIDANSKIEISTYYATELQYYQQKDAVNERGQVVCENAIHALNNELNMKDKGLLLADTIIGLQGLEIRNLGILRSKDKKVSRRRIIGFTVGGFTVGVGVTALALLLKK